jgi:Amt family ammonium transporter
LTLDPTNYTTILPLGFLGKLGAIDFAGGTVIHIASGFGALAIAISLGKRQQMAKLKPHNSPMIVIGGSFLIFGWFGFNAGSAGGAVSLPPTTSIASYAFINTHLAACAGAMSWMFFEKIILKSTSPAGAASGAVAGLVAITPGCGFVQPWAAIVFGLVVSPICMISIKLKSMSGLDDTLDAFGLHGVGGIVGAFCTGLFATKQVNFADGAFYGNDMLLGYQMAAITVSGAYSFFMTLIILEAMKRTVGIRISSEAESEGIDLSEHGAKAYAGSESASKSTGGA